MKIHILLIVDNTHENKSLNLPIGGIGNHILEILPAYAKIKDLHITVITKYSEYIPKTKNIKIYSIFKFRNSKINTIYFNLKTYQLFLKIHKRDPINVINIHSFYYNLTLPLIINYLYKIPIFITTPTDFYTGQKEEFIGKSGVLIPKILYYSWMKFFRKRIVRNKRIFVQAINEDIYQDFVKLNFSEDNLINVPNAISSAKYLAVKKDDHQGNVFGFLGRLIKSKNIRFMMKEFSEYVKENQTDVLYIFGKGPEETFIKNFISKNNLSNNIKYWGFLKDKLDIYRKIDILIHPSLGEGLPMSILEAILTNTFVIASDVSGNRDIIDHLETGLLFNPHKEGDLLEKLLYFKSHQEKVPEIRKKAKDKILSNFVIEVEVERIIKFLREKLSKQNK